MFFPSCSVPIFFLPFSIDAITAIHYCCMHIIFDILKNLFSNRLTLFMMSSLLSEDNTIEKGSTINDNIVFTSISSLPTICDNYTLTRTRNASTSVLVSVQQSHPPSYWYSIYDNNVGSVCELPRVGEYILSPILKICGLIRYQLLRGSTTMYLLKGKWKSFLTEY